MGVLMMSLEASHAQASAAGGVLTLLERALAAVPAALLSTKGARIAEVLVTVSNMHVDQPSVVRPALSCARRILLALPPKSSEAAKLWRWLLEFATHAHPKVRQRGQATCVEVLRDSADSAEGADAASAAAARRLHLSLVAAKFVESKLARPSLKELQPALYLLHFLGSAVNLLAPSDAACVAAALLQLPSLGHPLITKSALELLQAACAPEGASAGAGGQSSGCALPASALAAIIDALLSSVAAGGAAVAGSSAKAAAAAAAMEGPTLRAALAAATSLSAADASLGSARLAPLASAMLESLLHSHSNGGGPKAGAPPAGKGKGRGGKGVGGGPNPRAGGRGGGKGKGAEPEEAAPSTPLDALQTQHLSALVTGCVSKHTEPAAAAALAATLAGGLAPRYLPLWRPVLEASGELFSALAEGATPACDLLLTTMKSLFSDHKRLTDSRGTLMASLGLAARALGPQRFLPILPIKISTSDGGDDTSWLLPVLRNHLGPRATLGFFNSYFVPLQGWLLSRSAELAADERQIEAKNLHNLYEQVWALFPGFCASADDAAAAFPALAKVLGTTLQETPQLRTPILQGLCAVVLRQRSLREVVPRADGSGKVDVVPTAGASAALAAIGAYAKNFLPLLFNLHQTEPPEKRGAIQAAIGAYATAAPDEMLGEFFKSVLRKLLEATAASDGSQVRANRGRGGHTHGPHSTAPAAQRKTAAALMRSITTVNRATHWRRGQP